MTDLFPFGKPSTRAEPRRPAGLPRALVIGAYPSAFHVEWRLPAWLRERTHQSRVASFAVDAEPTVFWDGAHPPRTVETWCREVGFVAGDHWPCWGHVSETSMNGPSGKSVDREVLAPLGIKAAETFFTDIVPTFFVKRGAGKRRGQRDVIEKVYEPFVRALREGRAPAPPSASLPDRPPPRKLVRTAVREERERLLSVLADHPGALVITLGEEARAALGEIASSVSGSPATQLASDDAQYGREGTLHIDGVRYPWRALVHPGQSRADWKEARRRWLESLA